MSLSKRLGSSRNVAGTDLQKTVLSSKKTSSESQYRDESLDPAAGSHDMPPKQYSAQLRDHHSMEPTQDIVALVYQANTKQKA